jgi:pectinesterase
MSKVLARGVATAFFLCICAASGGAVEVDLLVAADGSGTYTRVQDAIAAVPSSGSNTYVIFIKPGTYTATYNSSTQTIDQFKVTQPNVTLRGLGSSPSDVVLTGNFTASQTSVGGSTLKNDTFAHATAVVTGANFSAYDLTFANTAGQGAGQALAMYTKADRLAFNDVRFLGWQDTLRTEYGRQYFEDTYVEGNTDFIYGHATAFFDDPTIYVKASGYVTAPDTLLAGDYKSRGYVFSGGQVTGAVNNSATLGRPWNAGGLAVYNGVRIGPVISSAGWTDVNNDGASGQEFFAEHKDLDLAGNLLNVSGRVSWSHQLTDADAQTYTLTNWLAGPDNWDARGQAAMAVVFIPEPASLSVLGVAGGVVLLRRRRHRAAGGLARRSARERASYTAD